MCKPKGKGTSVTTNEKKIRINFCIVTPLVLSIDTVIREVVVLLIFNSFLESSVTSYFYQYSGKFYYLINSDITVKLCLEESESGLIWRRFFLFVF